MVLSHDQVLLIFDLNVDKADKLPQNIVSKQLPPIAILKKPHVLRQKMNTQSEAAFTSGVADEPVTILYGTDFICIKSKRKAEPICYMAGGTAVLGKVSVPLEPDLQEWFHVILSYWIAKEAQQKHKNALSLIGGFCTIGRSFATGQRSTWNIRLAATGTIWSMRPNNQNDNTKTNHIKTFSFTKILTSSAANYLNGLEQQHQGLKICKEASVSLTQSRLCQRKKVQNPT